MKKTLKTIKLNENKISSLIGIILVLILGYRLYSSFTQKNKGEITNQAQQSDTLSSENQYLVKEGDTLWSIAEDRLGNGFAYQVIAQTNNITDPNLIEKGTVLTIPPVSGFDDLAVEKLQTDTYTVVRGDNLWKIAEAQYQDGYAWKKIAQANHLVNPGLIHAGNVLVLP